MAPREASKIFASSLGANSGLAQSAPGQKNETDQHQERQHRVDRATRRFNGAAAARPGRRWEHDRRRWGSSLHRHGEGLLRELDGISYAQRDVWGTHIGGRECVPVRVAVLSPLSGDAGPARSCCHDGQRIPGIRITGDHVMGVGLIVGGSCYRCAVDDR